jgi:ubiquinone/menaquinone biosynthesis C-methylase UbiE
VTSSSGRVADYDRIAAGYDRRYEVLDYGGVRDALVSFVGESRAILEVGCGTGHWLADLKTGASHSGKLEKSASPSGKLERSASPSGKLERSASPSGRLERSASPSGKLERSASLSGRLERSASLSGERHIAGIEPSSEMIARARLAAPEARLVRGRAEALPWGDATFDRVYCVNALHHFSDRAQFFAEARRILKPGGGLLTVGKDPHTERDAWWVYDYFPETLEIDRQRFARVRTLRGEMTLAGFSWSESFEADRIEGLRSATDALATGIVHRSFTSQLSVLTDEEFDAGVARMRAANDAAGGDLQLVTDFYLFATVGWV